MFDSPKEHKQLLGEKKVKNDFKTRKNANGEVAMVKTAIPETNMQFYLANVPIITSGAYFLTASFLWNWLETNDEN
jgi:hypothetical protein